jgi:hypothetical protein
MAIVAGVDLWYRRGQATRWKEYLFILAAGCVAAVFGSLIDLVTSSISPDYFIYGKGLPADGIRRHAMALGLKAGFSAGAIAGALCVFVGSQKRARAIISLPEVAMLSWRPFLTAGIFAALVPFACAWFDPVGYADKLGGPFGPDRAARFLTVWHIHLGVYLGLAVGVVWMIAAIRRLSAKDRRAADSLP